MPTTVLALDISRQAVGANASDVFVAVSGTSEDEVASLESRYGRPNLRYIQVDEALKEINEKVALSDTHVSPASLGRLFMNSFIPVEYSDILYLDGDILPRGDITPLLSLRTKPGHIAAAPDSMWLYENATTPYARKLQNYRQRFGGSVAAPYFNCGVLAFRRDTWENVGREAWAFFQKNAADCLFHDQSAVNVVVGNKVQWVSPAYNFSTDYRMMGFGASIRPKLTHFTGPLKPWLRKHGPWGVRPWRQYQDFLAANVDLRAYVPQPSQVQLRRMRNQFIMNAIEGTPGVRNPAAFISRWRRFRAMTSPTAMEGFVLR